MDKHVDKHLGLQGCKSINNCFTKHYLSNQASCDFRVLAFWHLVFLRLEFREVGVYLCRGGRVPLDAVKDFKLRRRVGA